MATSLLGKLTSLGRALNPFGTQFHRWTTASIQSLSQTSNKTNNQASLNFTQLRQYSSEFDDDFSDSREPFKPPFKRRYGYETKIYIGGPLPRPKSYEDIPLPGKEYDPRKKDQWTQKKALFGQNDYIDILGDGTIHPYQLMDGPKWLRGFRGNELQRHIRRLKFEGRMLQEFYPSKYNELLKQVFFLYKRYNRRKRNKFQGGQGSHQRSRLYRIKDVY